MLLFSMIRPPLRARQRVRWRSFDGRNSRDPGDRVQMQPYPDTTNGTAICRSIDPLAPPLAVSRQSYASPISRVWDM